MNLVNSFQSEELFPNQETIFHWIEDLCKTPHRRTGSSESLQAIKYLTEEFKKIGLENVTIEETESTTFELGTFRLTVCGKELSCFPINGTLHREEFGTFSTGTKCENRSIIYLGEGREEDFEGVDVKDKIVLCDCPWFDMDESIYASEWCSQETILFDPDFDSRERIRKTDSYSPNSWPYNYIMAQQKGASGFIGILTDYFEDGINWNEDYTDIGKGMDCPLFKIPGLWLGMTEANKVKKMISDGQAVASIDMTLTYQLNKAKNISGVLPGASEKAILVHSHYDSVFNGAVQDASGMSEVLALATYFAKVPKEDRKATLIFAGLDGHYTDYAGHKSFVNNLKNQNINILCDMVIEHIGKEVGIDSNNKPIIKENPELRLVYVTNQDEMVQIVESKIKKYDLRRTLIMPVNPYSEPEDGRYEFQQDEVISDAYYSHLAGFPIISMLSPQMYLFHPMDTPEMICKDQLVPIGKAYAEMIYELFKY